MIAGILLIIGLNVVSSLIKFWLEPPSGVRSCFTRHILCEVSQDFGHFDMVKIPVDQYESTGVFCL